jgi:hypothetical protein
MRRATALAGFLEHNSTKVGFLVLTSPLLSDFNTTIGVSASFAESSTSDTSGAPVGTSGAMVADSKLTRVPPIFEMPGVQEAHTQIVNLNLTPVELTARIAAVGNPDPTSVTESTSMPSYGEVENQSTNPASNANSFFDLFVDITVQAFPTLFNPFDPTNPANSKPLVVEALNLTSLPPQVVYTHTPATGRVPLLITGTQQQFGAVALAGHGIDFLDPPGDLAAYFQAEVDGYNAYDRVNLTGAPVIPNCPCAIDPFFIEEGIVEAALAVPEPAPWGILLFALVLLFGLRSLRSGG